MTRVRFVEDLPGVGVLVTEDPRGCLGARARPIGGGAIPLEGALFDQRPSDAWSPKHDGPRVNVSFGADDGGSFVGLTLNLERLTPEQAQRILTAAVASGALSPREVPASMLDQRGEGAAASDGENPEGLTCEVCGKPATHGYVDDKGGDGEPGSSHYCCAEHGPEDVGIPAHCRDCHFMVEAP